jgi:GT2 family glycosyltransferase
MIYKFQPFATDKLIGREYNGHCSLVPNDDDWILILDYDCQVLCPEAYQVIENAIKRYPDTAIFGALCNRVAYSHQRITSLPDEDDRMRGHIETAIDFAERYRSGEAVPARTVAGFFMLFRKSYWKQTPFQERIYDDKGNLFDYNFCRHAMKNKLPIRVIRGVYCWHSYRLLKESFKDTSHLRTIEA